MHVSLLKVCGACWRVLLSHHTPWQKNRSCPKDLLETSGEEERVLYLALDPLDWELRESALKSVQRSHSLKRIFRNKYPHEPRIGYLWSIGPELSLRIFVSSLHIVVGLRVNFERRWIHQSLKTCDSEKWMGWGQLFIKHENMMLKSFVVIQSFRSCIFWS